jgi:hypothetical protein
MDSWHGEIYEEIEKVAKSSCTVAEGMSVVVAACARHRSHPDWKRFAELDFLSDLEHLRGWLLNAFSSPPAGEVSGLWFGLFNPVYDGEDAADIYVSGSPYDPNDPDWACAVTWKPSGAYARSRALKAIFDISYGEDGLSYGNEGLEERGRRLLMNDGEYPLCLAYGALAVRWLATELEPRVLLGDAAERVLFVGFDSGDLICIGGLTSGGLDFSRDSFDYHAAGAGPSE